MSDACLHSFTASSSVALERDIFYFLLLQTDGFRIYLVPQIKWLRCARNLREADIYLKVAVIGTRRGELWKCLNIIRGMMKLFSNRRLEAHGVLMNFAS